MKLPPPATAFMAPPSTPAMKRKSANPRCKLNVYHKTMKARRSSITDRQGAHRKRRSLTDRRWCGEKMKVSSMELFQSAQVLDNGNTRGQQQGMRRTRWILHAVDV